MNPYARQTIFEIKESPGTWTSPLDLYTEDEIGAAADRVAQAQIGQNDNQDKIHLHRVRTTNPRYTRARVETFFTICLGGGCK
ncbi:hypothetical protein LCGC14_1938910 [marine sediment metagenome]|uniref:Uncharacterized protein n=1 Tax=marine sediment metagenome TaxID=412755 RepID=A0A0F9FL48_9ZZZZ